MRQALTAKGQLDAWMRSSEAALANMGVEDIMVDESSLHIEGKHPEHGPIGIDDMIPEMGKTRMVIQVDDPKMITAFKRAVTPVFKNVMKELEKLEEEQMQQAEAKINADQPDESADHSQEQEAPEAEMPGEEQSIGKPEPSETAEVPDEAEQEAIDDQPAAVEPADKPVKKKKKGPLIAVIVIAIVVIAAAASYFLYFRDHGLPFTKSASTTSSSSKSSNKSSTSGSSSSSSSDSQSTTTNNNNGTNASADANTNTNTAAAGTISKAQYDQINNGMTYDQVKQIIGSDGSKLSESTYKDAQGNTINVQIYYWKGNGSSDSNANITFQGNTVASKSSYGLK